MRGGVYIGDAVNWDASLNRGLVSWWKALPDQQRGNVFRDLCLRNHGTLTNGPLWSGVSHPGGWGSVLFDGTNDFCQTTLDGGTVGINNGVGSGRTDFSVSLWFRRSSTDVADVLWSWNADSLVVGLMVVATGLTFQNAGQDAANGLVTYDWTPDQEWHHCTVVEIARATTPKLYLDGLELAATTDSGAVNALASNLVIGGRVQASTCWRGWIDDVQVRNGAMSESQAAALYQESLAGHPTTLNWHRPRVYFDMGAAPPAGGRRFRYLPLLGAA